MPTPLHPTWVSMRNLKAHYSVLLFDAYGVLVDAGGPLPGACELMDQLNDEGHAYFILTNGSMRSPSHLQQSFRQMGLDIPLQRIVSSGECAANWLKERCGPDSRICLLGPAECDFLLPESAVRVGPDEDFDFVVLGNQDGFPLLTTLDQVLSVLVRRLRAGHTPRVVVPNPDLIYPAGRGNLGITSGMLGLILEAGVRVCLPHTQNLLVAIGKPTPNLIVEAARRHGTDLSELRTQMVMIGDQIQTDVASAHAAGCASALIGTGLSDINTALDPAYRPPTHLLGNLLLDASSE